MGTCRLAIVSCAVTALFAAWGRGDVTINGFDSAAEASNWRYDFGSASQSILFDPTMDAAGSAASGSLKFTIGFNSALGGNNKIAFTRDISPGLNATDYTGMSMDLMIDPNSATDFYGGNGYLSLVIRDGPTYTYTPQFNNEVFAIGGWQHISIQGLQGPIDDIRGITLQLYGGPQQNLTGTVNMWIDNLVLTTPTPGDANVDGRVDFNDVLTLIQHYGTMTGASWPIGDFNGDGKVDFSDVLALIQNYGVGVTRTQAGELPAVAQAPEPTGPAVFALAAIGLLRRRRAAVPCRP